MSIPEKPMHNTPVADHGDWLEIDVSTTTLPAAIMKIDAEDWRRFRAGCSGKVGAHSERGRTYARYWQGNKSHRMHRFVLGLSSRLDVDHRNHDGLDNRKLNLRVASRSENNANRTPSTRSVSGITGVVWHKAAQKWMASIKKNRRRVYLGLYDCVEDAAAARKAAEIEYFGKFAYREVAP